MQFNWLKMPAKIAASVLVFSYFYMGVSGSLVWVSPAMAQVNPDSSDSSSSSSSNNSSDNSGEDSAECCVDGNKPDIVDDGPILLSEKSGYDYDPDYSSPSSEWFEATVIVPFSAIDNVCGIQRMKIYLGSSEKPKIGNCQRRVTLQSQEIKLLARYKIKILTPNGVVVYGDRNYGEEILTVFAVDCDEEEPTEDVCYDSPNNRWATFLISYHPKETPKIRVQRIERVK